MVVSDFYKKNKNFKSSLTMSKLGPRSQFVGVKNRHFTNKSIQDSKDVLPVTR